jgi:hypothetical protein
MALTCCALELRQGFIHVGGDQKVKLKFSTPYACIANSMECPAIRAVDALPANWTPSTAKDYNQRTH